MDLHEALPGSCSGVMLGAVVLTLVLLALLFWPRRDRRDGHGGGE